jgi:hypothetical protein
VLEGFSKVKMGHDFLRKVVSNRTCWLEFHDGQVGFGWKILRSGNNNAPMRIMSVHWVTRI